MIMQQQPPRERLAVGAVEADEGEAQMGGGETARGGHPPPELTRPRASGGGPRLPAGVAGDWACRTQLQRGNETGR